MTFGSFRPFVLLCFLTAAALVPGSATANAQEALRLPDSASAQAVPPTGASAKVGDLLISRQLASERGLAVGSVVQLATDAAGTGARTFRIVGIYGPTPDPARLGALPRGGPLHPPTDRFRPRVGTHAAKAGRLRRPVGLHSDLAQSLSSLAGRPPQVAPLLPSLLQVGQGIGP